MVDSPKLALLKRLREHVADRHVTLIEGEAWNHRAIAECECDVARDYRALKQWIKQRSAQRERRAHAAFVAELNHDTPAPNPQPGDDEVIS